MGVEIVKAAMVHGKRLSGNAYKVLVTMSMSALDKPSNGRPASLYWGGWDALAVALGHENAERGTSGHNAVARAVRELRGERHISPMIDAGRGMRQSYLVHPGGLTPSGQGEQNAHAKGEQIAHAKGEQNAHVGVSKTLTPRKEQGSSSDKSQDISLPSATQLQTAREDEKRNEEMSPHKFQGQPAEGDCLACGLAYLNRKAHPLHLLRGA